MSLSTIKKLLCAHRISRLTAEKVKNILQTPAFNLAGGAAEAAISTCCYSCPRWNCLINNFAK